MTHSYPPRKLPLSVTIGLFLSSTLSQVGWFIFGFGMIFFWVFGANADYSAIQFSQQLSQQTGNVIESEELNYEINEQSVYKVYYRYIAPDGTEIEDYSYSVGRYFSANKSVTIEFPSNNPYLSRIEGLRRSPFGIALSLITLFPLTGLVMILFGVKKGRKALQLLTHGTMTSGELQLKEATNTSINDQTVYKFTFTFKDDTSQTHTIIEKTHHTQKLEDDNQERILYLPNSPQNAMMFDTLPGEPKLDSTGNILPSGLGSVIGRLLWPAIILSGHLTYYVIGYVL